MSDSLRPIGLLPTGLLSQWNSPCKTPGGGSHSPGDRPNPGIETVSFASRALQADSLLSELAARPIHIMNTQ